MNDRHKETTERDAAQKRGKKWLCERHEQEDGEGDSPNREVADNGSNVAGGAAPSRRGATHRKERS